MSDLSKKNIRTSKRQKKIRELNDEIRTLVLPNYISHGSEVPSGVRFFFTRGIQELFPEHMFQILAKVSNYEDFTKENDPYGERDFGNFDYEGVEIFWKFDYYDRELKYGSEDPADPEKTTRVLTVMLASEY